MGCFIAACFRSSKHRKLPKLPNTTPSGDQSHEKCEPLQPIKEASIVESIISISESKDKNEEQLNSSIRKKVAFDSNEVAKFSVETEEEIEREKEAKNETENQEIENCSVLVQEEESYPPKHRYHNCTSRDDEYEEDMDLEDDSDSINDHIVLVQEEESSESLFSLSIEPRNQVNTTVEMDDKEVNSPLTICGSPKIELKLIGSNQNGHSVLNPVENLILKGVNNGRTTPPPLKKNNKQQHHQEKENVNLEPELHIPIIISEEEPSFNFKWSIHNSKAHDHQIAVDASFSSWLVESERSPPINRESNYSSSGTEGANSWRSFEDRPILGEIKHLSTSSTSRRPRSPSPDEIPIVGTVGSYWSHTGQTMDSDSSSSRKGMSGTSSKFRGAVDKRVLNCHSTSTSNGARLEKALNSGIAQV